MGQKGREVNRRELLARPISGPDTRLPSVASCAAISGRYQFHSEENLW